MRPRRAALAALAAALTACGTGLYDAAGVPSANGGGLTCGEDQALCAGVCTTASAEQCGDACESCFDLVPSPPLHARAACLAGQCGYECLEGYLKCGAGCCETAAVGAGETFTCAALAGGEARCWGANDRGQLGNGGTTDRPRPGPVLLPGAAAQSAGAIGAGIAHACAVLTSGAVVCWGDDSKGQVSGTSTAAARPEPTAAPVSSGASAVVAGAAHTCALVGGAVRCWGDDAMQQLGGAVQPDGASTPIAAGATALAAGRSHTCAIVAGGVRCWGDGAAGQLGGAVDGGGLSTPIAADITMLAARGDQVCASSGVSNNTALDDVVRCWGTGLGATFALGEPQPTPAIPLKDARPGSEQATIRDDLSVLAVGGRHACVQRVGGAVECFGADNARGQLGAANVPAGSAESWPVTGNLVASAIAAGTDHTCAVLADARLVCWGANDRGQLGIGTLTDPPPGDVVAPSGR